MLEVPEGPPHTRGQLGNYQTLVTWFFYLKQISNSLALMVSLLLKSSSANGTWNVEGNKEEKEDRERSENWEGKGRSLNLRRSQGVVDNGVKLLGEELPLSFSGQ